jgi:CRP-like cAMP-binding protein
MAAKRPVAVGPGSVLTVVNRKKSRKHLGKQIAPSHLVAAHGPELNPAEVGALHQESAAFDPHVFLTKLAAGKTSREYKGDESVFSQGDVADAVFYIQSGKVKLTAVSAQGKEAVVAILPEASFFGEGCLAGQPLRMATATAMQRATVIRVTKQAMVTLLHQEPEFAERFLAYLLSRNIRMEADLVDHLFNSSEKRLARLLLLLANFGQESKPIPLIAKISQETLADMIGTTRSRVSFFLNRFRDLGFIAYNGGGMHVHSSLVSVVSTIRPVPRKVYTDKEAGHSARR